MVCVTSQQENGTAISLHFFCGNSKEVMAADVMDAMKKNKATDERSFKEEYRKLRHCLSPNLLEKKITSYYF